MLEGKKVILHYEWYGQGKKTLLAFHGFGQTGRVMRPLAEAMEGAYRTCLIDIFYHGRSYWHEELGPLTKDHWQLILSQFLEHEEVDRFSMVAFSMGGKFLLATLEGMPQRVEHLYLIAPDGIRTSTWYSLASYPILFRKYFRSMIVRPWRFFSLMRFLRAVGILDDGLAKFASTQMDTRRKRRRVYYTWVMFRKLRFDKKRIARLINHHGISTDIFIGRYDKIITADGMKKLTIHLNSYKLHALESGHNQLIQAVAGHLNAKK